MVAVVDFAEQFAISVAATFKGEGLVSDTHRLGCGVRGQRGTPITSWFINESDLVIVFGASLSDHTETASYKPTIRVDDDPMALGWFHAVDVPMHANAVRSSSPKDQNGHALENPKLMHSHTREVRGLSRYNDRHVHSVTDKIVNCD